MSETLTTEQGEPTLETVSGGNGQTQEANGSGTENTPKPVSTEGSNGEDTTGSNSSTVTQSRSGKPAQKGTEGGKASSHQATGTEGQGGATPTTDEAASTQEVLEGLERNLTE